MKNLSHLAARFTNAPLFIHQPKLDTIVQAFGSRFGLDTGKPEATANPQAFGYADQAEAREYQVVDGIAVIPVTGVLTKKDSWMNAYSGMTSYEEIGRQVNDAVNDSAVRAIILQVDSPGGETTGCLELSDFIYSQRGAKPIYAVADDFAFSAAYGLASAADKIFVTRMGAVGSIGVVVLHTDQSGFDAQIGVKYKYLFKGDKKVDANPHEALSERAEADIDAELDRQYDQFVATVARNRKVDAAKIEATEAGLFWGDGGIPLLADQVGTMDDAIAAIHTALGMPVQVSGATRSPSVSAAPVVPEVAAVSAAASAALVPKGVPMADEKVPVVAAADKKDGDGEDNSFCHACGAQLHDGAKFCHACGEPVTTPDGKKTTAAEAQLAQPSAVAIPGRVVEMPRASGMPAEDLQAITALCTVAGVSAARLGTFLAAKQDGKFYSVAEVSEALTAERVAESEKHMIHSHVNPNAGSGGVAELETQATAFARQNRGQVNATMYVPNSTARITPERTYAAMLEEHPEAYEQYRAQHNAGGIIRQLEAAGVRLSR